MSTPFVVAIALASHFFSLFTTQCIFRTVDEHLSQIRNHSSLDATSAAHDFSLNSQSPVSICDAAEDNRVKLISTADQRENAASAQRMTGESEDDAATPVFPPLNAVTFPENLIQLPLRNIGVANNGRCRSIDSGIPFGCAQTENPGSPPEGSGLATESTNIHGLLQTENHG